MSDQQSSRRDLLRVGAVGLGTVSTAAFFPSVAAAGTGEAATAVVPVSPSYRYFLEISGIPGDSADATYRHQIVVSGWSWGMSNSGIISGGGGAGAGKSSPMDFVYIAPMSVASPLTMLAVATGKHLDHAVLTVVAAAGRGTKRMTVRFVEVLVSSYQQSSGDSNGFPVDVVNLSYRKVIHSVYPQKPDGSTAAPVTAMFDFRSGRSG